MDFLFDIGRVLLDFDFDRQMRRLVDGGPPDAHARLMEALEDRNDFESGKVEPDVFVRRMIDASGAWISPEDFIDAWRHLFTRNAPMWEAVMKLKSEGGHRMILFSNTNAIHCPWIFDEFPELNLFDAAVLSYEIGTMKPEPAIYEYAIREFALDPAKTRYIDDLPENIAAGERFGFRCHLYDLRNHDLFERWLAEELRSGA